MYIDHVNNVKKESLADRGGKGASLQWLLARKENVPYFYMRYAVVEPGGFIPLHSHEWIHEMYIVKGSGVLLSENEDTPLETGSFVYMPSNEAHGMKNTGSENLEFVCCINKPSKDD